MYNLTMQKMHYIFPAKMPNTFYHIGFLYKKLFNNGNFQIKKTVRIAHILCQFVLWLIAAVAK